MTSLEAPTIHTKGLRYSAQQCGRRRAAWLWLRVAVLTLTAAVALFATHSPHFQHHNERLLRELASASSIRVQFTSKSPLARLTIAALLFPRTDASTQQLTFDGRLSYDFLDQEYNFTMVDGRGYVTVQNVLTNEMVRNDCLHRDEIPPVHLLVDALREARVVDDASADVSCDGGKLVEFAFAGETYVFCSRANGAIDKIHGDDLEATVQLLRDNTADAPTLASLVRPDGLTTNDCELLTQAESSETPFQAGTVKAARLFSRAATRAQDVATLLTGESRQASDDDCATACKGGKKICLFVHGLGKSEEAPLADKYEAAWGEAAWEDLHCCSQTKFMRMDTVTNAWHHAKLPSQVCDAAVALTQSKDPMNLENLAIISHSMGNLVVAAAAVKNLCAVGPTSKWIALAGPIAGSQSANLGVSTCKEEAPILKDTVRETLTSTEMCPAKDATQSLVYRGSEESFAELNALYDGAIAVFKQRVTASLCGVSSIGLASMRSTKYYALGLVSGHGSDHDGAVEINSCGAAFGVDSYQTSWKGGKLYKASVNHADAALRNGDGIWGDARKPIKWLNCQF